MARYSKAQYRDVSDILHKRHEALQNMLRSYRPRSPGNIGLTQRLAEHLKITNMLGMMFQYDNPAFDFEHFLKVIRGEEPVGSRPRHTAKP